jgi:sugar phosphate isomerase/epimerase
MRLAVSSLAWPHDLDAAVAQTLRQLGVCGVELVPTKVWPKPTEVGSVEVRNYRRFWEDQGFRPVAMQALLFGQPELTIFDGAVTRERTLEYLGKMCRLGEWLGTGVLVFGSPRNRAIGARSPAEVTDIAVSFFRRAGALARWHGVTLCIEPNPPAYQCDFITTTSEGLRFVAAVGDSGFGLHVDAGTIAVNKEVTDPNLPSCLAQAKHFHISEPFLAPVGGGTTDHRQVAEVVRTSGFEGWLSIEMKEAKADILTTVTQAVQYACVTYHGCGEESLLRRKAG